MQIRFCLIFAFLSLKCTAFRNGGLFDRNGHNDRGVFATGSTCLGENGVQGICTNRISCSKQGGTAVGLCGIFGTCCSLSTCDLRTNLKTATFTNPTIPDSGIECSYSVEINNLNVCQIRIDFEVFSLSLPTTVIDATTMTGPGYECHDDAFEITGDLPGVNVPILCGENVNQHVYVRVNASQNVRGFQMHFRIVGRGNRPTLQQPSWRLKVTQLECYNMPRKFKEIAILNNVPDFKLTADRDEYLNAPPGCLQYYPDRSGSIESFNYNRGTGPYLGNLLYAMCFRRLQNVCGIRFTASTFQIESETSGENDGDCQVISSGTGTGDYLLLPEAQSSEGTRASKWCGSSMTTQIVAVMPPGPLYIHFRSDDLVKNAAREQGFRLNYNLMSNCN